MDSESTEKKVPFASGTFEKPNTWKGPNKRQATSGFKSSISYTPRKEALSHRLPALVPLNLHKMTLMARNPYADKLCVVTVQFENGATSTPAGEEIAGGFYSISMQFIPIGEEVTLSFSSDGNDAGCLIDNVEIVDQSFPVEADSFNSGEEDERMDSQIFELKPSPDSGLKEVESGPDAGLIVGLLFLFVALFAGAFGYAWYRRRKVVLENLPLDRHQLFVNRIARNLSLPYWIDSLGM